MAYEVVYVDGVQKDLAKEGFSDDKIRLLTEWLEELAKLPEPRKRTERLRGIPLVKVRLGDHRVFLHIDETVFVIYVLAILHRKNCYSRQQIDRVLTRERRIFVRKR